MVTTLNYGLFKKMRLKHDRRVNLITVKTIHFHYCYVMRLNFMKIQGAVTVVVLQFMQVINKQHNGVKHVFL